jgi:glutathione S-transferase
MPTPHPIVISGAHSSPYSRKMRSVLRYRQIPHRWVVRGSRWDDLPKAPVPIIPVLAFPDDAGNHGEVMVDSSPQITRLEQDFAERSLVPPDPALAFIDFLLEDFANEWVTKAMYHYRWANEADTEKSGRLLPFDKNLQLSDEDAAKAHDFFINRQLSRRGLVGSTDANAPIIERSYTNVLDILQAHLAQHDFMFGDRPGRSDFAMYGQLTPLLWWDPTPMAVAVEHAPRAVMWVQWVDDLAWLPVDGHNGWLAIDDLADTVGQLLTEAGRTYAPFMIANAEASRSSAVELVCEIDGMEYRQAPFKYQQKCLTWIRDGYAALSDVDQQRVDKILAGTGCEVLVTT